MDDLNKLLTYLDELHKERKDWPKEQRGFSIGEVEKFILDGYEIGYDKGCHEATNSSGA